MPEASPETRLRKYKVYALLHASFIAFLAVMTLIIPNAVTGVGSTYPYRRILAPYWVGFFHLIISIIAFVSCKS